MFGTEERVNIDDMVGQAWLKQTDMFNDSFSTRPFETIENRIISM